MPKYDTYSVSTTFSKKLRGFFWVNIAKNELLYTAVTKLLL